METLEDAMVQGPRRPYRWWRKRACVAENRAWGTLALPWSDRTAQAVEGERQVLKSDRANSCEAAARQQEQTAKDARVAAYKALSLIHI